MQDGSKAQMAAPRRGRPRDPQLEARILQAALETYGRQGWLGYNLDVVARSAGVSKDAVYRRWRTRDELLDEALKRSWSWIDTIDTGSLAEDLLLLGQATFTLFAGTYGEVALQLRADTRRFKEVKVFAEPYREQMVAQGRAIVRRAKERNDPAAAKSPGLILDLIVGAIINHIVSTPTRLRERMLENADAFVRDLVAVVMSGMAQLSDTGGA